VRQYNSGAAEDFILPYSALYLRIQNWKNYWNRSTFAKVVVKVKVARFLWTTVYYSFFMTSSQKFLDEAMCRLLILFVSQCFLKRAYRGYVARLGLYFPSELQNISAPDYLAAHIKPQRTSTIDLVCRL